MAGPHNLFVAPASIFRTIPCPLPGCNRWFCNNAGLTQHTRAKHLIPPLRQPERPVLAPWPLDDEPNPPSENVDALMDGDMPSEANGLGFEWEHHPLLCGTFLFPASQPRRSAVVS